MNVRRDFLWRLFSLTRVPFGVRLSCLFLGNVGRNVMPSNSVKRKTAAEKTPRMWYAGCVRSARKSPGSTLQRWPQESAHGAVPDGRRRRGQTVAAFTGRKTYACGECPPAWMMATREDVQQLSTTSSDVCTTKLPIRLIFSNVLSCELEYRV